MRILVVCEHGNNRSVTIAQHIKYWGHDVLTVGTETNSPGTVDMLVDWSERVIVVDRELLQRHADNSKVQYWETGPDIYPRPFNKNLMKKLKPFFDKHRAEYAP
jgi:hypothetical protein